MTEKKMTLEELTRWLDNNHIPYQIDDEGRLTVKGDPGDKFRIWVRTRKYTSLPDELFRVEGDLWLHETPITALGNLTFVGGYLALWGTPITSLGSRLTSVGRNLDLRETPITSLGNLASVGGNLYLQSTLIASLRNLPQVSENLLLDKNHLQLLTRETLQKVGRGILYRKSSEYDRATVLPYGWATLSLSELEAIVTENETRDSLNNTRENSVDWDLYDR